jgi:16S rRNA (guanine527-N7)-methyltransferase
MFFILTWSALLLLALFCSSHQVSAFLLHKKNSFASRGVLPLLSSPEDGSSFSTSSDFAIDPTSPKAKEIMNHLGLTTVQHTQLAALAVLVVDWNERINLISRRDCCKEVVFGRHIIPSLAPLGLKENPIIQDKQRVVDVGTGGGFPGLPLAIAYPNVDFLLVDSVGKKLVAVKDMAETLKLTNVKIHHGRAEELEEKDFDVCVGRSVAGIPTFCLWTQNLLKKKDGRLLYMIGGDIKEELLDQAIVDRAIDDLLDCPNASDKRVLVFPQDSVKKIAADSGEKLPAKQKTSFGNKKKQQTKGAWVKRDNSAPKQRGYETLKRFDSLNPDSR